MKHKTLADAFLSGLSPNLNSDDCWPWLGDKNYKDYGEFYFQGKRYRTHRLAYQIFIGEIKPGSIVMHTCDNPCCVNPKHLTLGTNQDNIIDSVKKDRWHQAKLNTEAVKVIKWFLKYKPERGLASKLARVHGVGRSVISSIASGKVWSFIEV